MRVGKAGDWSCQWGKKALLMPPSPQPGQGKDPSPRGSSTEPTGACLAQVAAGPGECHRSLSHPVPLGSPALSPPLLLPGAGWI